METNKKVLKENLQQEDQKEIKEKKIKSYLVIIILLIITATLYFFIYQYLRRNFSRSRITSPSPSQGFQPADKEGTLSSPSITGQIPSDWEIEVNTQFRYSFYHPKEYLVNLDNEEKYGQENNIDIKNAFINLMGYTPPILLSGVKVEKMKLVDASTGQVNYDQPVLRIWIFNNDQNMSINEWYEKYWFYPFHWGQGAVSVIEENRPKSEIEIDGIPGNYTYVNEKGKVKYLYFECNNKMFLLSYNVSFIDKEGYKESGLGSQILSTFKFIKEYEATPDPRNCGTDEDCQLEQYKAEACCSSPCSLESAINKNEAEQRNQWRAINCVNAPCPIVQCIYAPYHFVPKCVNKVCEAIKVFPSPN